MYTKFYLLISVPHLVWIQNSLFPSGLVVVIPFSIIALEKTLFRFPVLEVNFLSPSASEFLCYNQNTAKCVAHNYRVKTEYSSYVIFVYQKLYSKSIDF